MATTGPFYQPPGVGDIQAASQEEQRLREMLMALEGQDPSAAPLQSGKFAVLNLAPLSAAMRERRLSEKLDLARKKKSDLQGAYLDEVARRLRAFKTEEEGQTQVTPLLDDNGEAVTNKLPGNKRAFKNYESDPYPEVRALAGERRKEYDTLLKALREKAGFKSIQAAGDDVDRLREQPKMHIGADGIWQETEDGLKLSQGTTQVPNPDGSGGVVNRSPGGALKSLSGQTINVGEQKAGTEVRKKQGSAVVERATALGQSFPRQLRGLESAEQMVQQGTFDGPIASWVEVAAGLLQQFGFAPDAIKDTLARSQQRNSDIGRFVLESIKALGANPSNADRIYAEMTAGGKGLSREGQLRVIEAAKADLANDILQHNRQADELGKVIPEVLDSRLPAPTPEALGLRNYELDPQLGLLRPVGKRQVPPVAAPAQVPGARQPRRTPEGAPGTQPTSGRLEILQQELAAARAAGRKEDEAALMREIISLGGVPAEGANGQPAVDWTKNPAEIKRRADAALKKYLGGR